MFGVIIGFSDSVKYFLKTGSNKYYRYLISIMEEKDLHLLVDCQV